MLEHLNRASALYIVYILVTCMPVSATRLSPETRFECSKILKSDESAILAAADEIFMIQTQSLNSHPENWRIFGSVVVGAFKYLANHKQLNQRNKAIFWRRIVILVNRLTDNTFVSEEFTGVDGSIVFQGALGGRALVLSKDGRAFQGSLHPTLGYHKFAEHIWNADYSELSELRAP